MPCCFSINGCWKPSEVLRALSAMLGTPRLMAQLLYGAGLRVMECMTLRVKDFNFDRGTIVCARARATTTG